MLQVAISQTRISSLKVVHRARFAQSDRVLVLFVLQGPANLENFHSRFKAISKPSQSFAAQTF